MAHAARISELTDGLIQSVTGIGKDHARHKQVKATVARGLRDQSHARTNQFEVKSGLDGLVEKFGVLNRDDLADSLQARQEELPTGNKWLPEMLALCLALSDRPAEKTPVGALKRLVLPLPVEETLSWNDIVAADPLDEPGIWHDIERGYHSSGDEEFLDDEATSEPTASTTATSVEDDLEALAALHIQQPSDEVLERIEATRSGLRNTNTGQPVMQHELTLVRECLAMLRGFDTTLFQSDPRTGTITLRLNLAIKDAAPSTVKAALNCFAIIGSGLQALRNWTRSKQKQPYLRTLQASTERILSTFGEQVSRLDERYVCHSAKTVVSIAECLTQTEGIIRQVLDLAGLIRRTTSSNTTKWPFTLFDALYEHICSAQMAGDDESTQMLGKILCEAMQTYLRTASEWIVQGKASPANDDDFFVQGSDRECSLGEIWHARYAIRRGPSGEPSAPVFMQHLAPRIFAMGKARMFMDHLRRSSANHDDAAGHERVHPTFEAMFEQLQDSPLLPFSQALDDCLQDWLQKISTDSTPQLKRSIFNDHGLSTALRDVNAVCLSGNGAQSQLFAETLFGRIDRSRGRWANAFLLTELARDAFGGIAPAQNITIRLDDSQASVPTAIEALQALHLQYHFSWPIQNITREATTTTHTRAFTLLLQIVRARYVLRDQVFALRPRSSLRRPDACASLLRLREKLLAYTMLLHTHSATVSRLLSTEVQEQMSAAADIDAMVAVYAAYKQRLELSLLLGANLKPVHDAIISLLVVCEKMRPVWDAAMAVEDGNVPKELSMSERDLQKEFDGLTSFITTGVRSVSRAGAEPLLVMLAEQLDWLAE